MSSSFSFLYETPSVVRCLPPSSGIVIWLLNSVFLMFILRLGLSISSCCR